MKKEIKITLTSGKVIELTDSEYDELRMGLSLFYPYPPLQPHPIEPFPGVFPNPWVSPFTVKDGTGTETSLDYTIRLKDGDITFTQNPKTNYGGEGDSK